MRPQQQRTAQNSLGQSVAKCSAVAVFGSLRQSWEEDDKKRQTDNIETIVQVAAAKCTQKEGEKHRSQVVQGSPWAPIHNDFRFGIISPHAVVALFVYRYEQADATTTTGHRN